MKRGIINRSFSYLLKWISSLPAVRVREAFIHLLHVLEHKTKQHITYHFRPSKAEMISSDPSISIAERIVIVMQGPVITENNFTLDTIRIYKKIFPYCEIVLSTWADQDVNELKKFERENIHVVLCDKPEYFGNENVNLQIVSTKKGMEYAKRLNCSYAIKTRTDQRIYDRNAMVLLLNIIKAFPLVAGINQKQRIVCTSLITLKYRYYGMSDMFMFGDIDDLCEYWNTSMDKRTIVRKEKYTMEEHAKLRVGEVYFLTDFLERKGEQLIWTLQHTYDVYKQRFCIIDYQMLSLIWPKYEPRDDNRYNYYDSVHTMQRLAFADWLNIYNGSPVMPQEQYTSFDMGATIQQ